MRKYALAAVLLWLTATIAVAQQGADQSATDKAKGAASSVGNAVKSGAETGANKTKEGAEKAYGATKNALTGSSHEQTSEQNQNTGEGKSKTATGNLPHTASPIPLIGLLGLGTVGLGAWKARWFRR